MANLNQVSLLKPFDTVDNQNSTKKVKALWE